MATRIRLGPLAFQVQLGTPSSKGQAELRWEWKVVLMLGNLPDRCASLTPKGATIEGGGRQASLVSHVELAAS